VAIAAVSLVFEAARTIPISEEAPMALAERSIEDDVAALLSWDLDFLRDPHPTFKRLRERAPVYWIEEKGTALVFPYALVKSVCRDKRFRQSTGAIALHHDARSLLSDEESGMVDALLEFSSLYLASHDGPEHRRLRGACTPMFTRSNMRTFEARVQELTDQLLDELEQQEEPDFYSFAWQLPVLAMMDLIGAPREDANLVKRLSDDLLAWFWALPWQPENVRASYEALQQFKEYVARLVEDHRKHPRQDLTMHLIAALDAGTITDDELPAQITLFIFGGHETTEDLLSKGLLALLTERDQFERLVADPSLAPSAVEEIVRYENVVILMQRVAKVDVELEGVQIPAGSNLTLYNPAANRDPAVFADPDRLDIGRKPNEHIGWGQAAHFCIGAPLARLEGATAFATIARRYPGLELRVPRMEVEVVRQPPRMRAEFTVPVSLG
jgi:cytochrome P450